MTQRTSVLLRLERAKWRSLRKRLRVERRMFANGATHLALLHVGIMMDEIEERAERVLRKKP